MSLTDVALHQRSCVIYPLLNLCMQSDPRVFLQAVLGPGGILASERCIEAHVDMARQHGAEVRLEETVLSWHADEGGITVRTNRADYRARKAVFAGGSWMPQLIPELQVSLADQKLGSLDGNAAVLRFRVFQERQASCCLALISLLLLLSRNLSGSWSTGVYISHCFSIQCPLHCRKSYLWSGK